MDTVPLFVKVGASQIGLAGHGVVRVLEHVGRAVRAVLCVPRVRNGHALAVTRPVRQGCHRAVGKCERRNGKSHYAQRHSANFCADLGHDADCSKWAIRKSTKRLAFLRTIFLAYCADCGDVVQFTA